MKIHIAKVNGILWSGDADSITVPGSEGELTVLPNHVPLVTNMKQGRIVVKKDGEEVFTYETDHGIFEVTGESATILL